MATKLYELKVTSVDFVDRGANPDAHITLYKRDSSGDAPAEKPLSASMTAASNKGSTPYKAPAYMMASVSQAASSVVPILPVTSL